MTEEAQRIALAEACGWTGFENSGEFLIGVRPQNEITEKLLGPKRVTNWTARDDVPDYLHSLDAMHEAEKVLNVDQWATYYITLNKQVCACGNIHTCGYTISATAAQRAEAFLRTLNLWDVMK